MVRISDFCEPDNQLIASKKKKIYNKKNIQMIIIKKRTTKCKDVMLLSNMEVWKGNGRGKEEKEGGRSETR